MTNRLDKEVLKSKKRSELVEIARDMGIEGLFGMTSTEIVEAICETAGQSRSSSALGSYAGEIKEKLLTFSRPDLVEIGKKVGMEGMFSMRSREIAEEIYRAENLGDVINEIEEKAEPDTDPEAPPTNEEPVDTTRYAERIRSSGTKSDAMEEVNEFDSRIQHLDSDQYDLKMKALFDELSTYSDSEIGAREYIISLCSTKRPGDMAEWVYDLYKALGYPVDRRESLDLEDLMYNLWSGEKYLAREIPYKDRR